MRFVDITPETEGAFLHCLGALSPDDGIHRSRGQWYQEHRTLGYRAKVLVLASGEVVGKCHFAPIDQSPLVGRDLLVILCLYVHMYRRHVGDRRGRGYGRFMLEAVEGEAREGAYKGVAAWAMDWDWNPVSFYDHMGYERVDREDKVVLVWKAWAEDAQPPRLLRLPQVRRDEGNKVHVLVADNAWCNGMEKLRTAQEAIQGIEELVVFESAGHPCQGRIIHLGHVGGVYLDGEPYRPYQLIGSAEDLRAEIVRRYEAKRGETH